MYKIFSPPFFLSLSFLIFTVQRQRGAHVEKLIFFICYKMKLGKYITLMHNLYSYCLYIVSPKMIPFVAAPIILQAMFRTRGGYYYRSLVCFLCLSISACYGVFASLILPIFGKRHLINWSVARVYKTVVSTFLGITCTIEGKEHIRKDGGQAVYVCNHQTMLDVFFMANVFPKSTSVVAKKSIKFVPVLGWFSKCEGEE